MISSCTGTDELPELSNNPKYNHRFSFLCSSFIYLLSVLQIPRQFSTQFSSNDV